jgi:hypothetical protein
MDGDNEDADIVFDDEIPIKDMKEEDETEEDEERLVDSSSLHNWFSFKLSEDPMLYLRGLPRHFASEPVL